MSIFEFLPLVLTSVVISSIISFALTYVFENRQKHRYEMEVENLRHMYAVQVEALKADIMIDADVRHEIIERRLESYPHLVELVYRTRNMARDIIRQTNPSSVFIDALQLLAVELEECLYVSRIDLERDGVFVPVHTYKNLLKMLLLDLGDAMSWALQGESAQRDQVVEKISSLYARIEGLHSLIINKLTSITAAENALA